MNTIEQTRTGGARRRFDRGVTLVELLIVLGVIGLITAVVVPFAVNAGWFTSSKASFAAREYYTLLKAASVYAGTYNVETAVAYGTRIVEDSEQLPENPNLRYVPVVESLVLARRLKREEIIELRERGHGLLVDPSADYYVPIESVEGIFRPLPNQTCLLPDIFEIEPETVSDPLPVSKTGLLGVRLYDIADAAFLEPRYFRNPITDELLHLDYSLDGYVPDENDPALPGSFPAHLFKPDGTLRVHPDLARQRLRVRTGVLPEAAYSDRFHTGEDAPPEQRDIYIVFNDLLRPRDVPIPTYYSTDPSDPIDTFADIDSEIELFVATGRIKVLP